MKIQKKGFTLVELITGIAIAGIVLTSGFYALNLITLSRVKLIEETEITKEAFYVSQKLFEDIKAGGTIDYEEYFNRKIIGTITGSGHYSTPSGFGNYGSGGTLGSSTYGDNFYYCRSGNGVFMGTGGCFSNTFNTYSSAIGAKQQRFGQYVFQFIDFNINQDGDGGDQNMDGDIRNDQDDEHLGEGPEAFPSGTNLNEIYLMSGDGKKRTYFRWNVKMDTNKPASETCNFSTATGTGCLGNIEILKLEGRDRGVNHSKTGVGAFDGIIDTWIISPEFNPGTEVIAGRDNINYWQPIFGDNISVQDFKVFAYPNKDINQAWKSNLEDANINPYLRIDMTLVPGWKKRARMKGKLPEIKISTTINLVDYFSK